MPAQLRPGLIALVVGGGTVGTLVRALLEESSGAGGWPWVTFSINAVGSFLLGLLVAVLARVGGDRRVRLFVGTGVLGGFTTYSTFVVEVDQLLRDGQLGLGGAYAFGSVVLGVLAAGLGFVVGSGRTSGAAR